MLFTLKKFSCLKETVVNDNKLKWTEHINCISKKIGVIIKAWKVFDKTTLLSIYNSLTFIGYSIHIWGIAYQTHIQKRHVLQNKIIRIIAGNPRRTLSDYLYCELNILKLKKLHLYDVGMMLPEFLKICL